MLPLRKNIRDSIEKLQSDELFDFITQSINQRRGSKKQKEPALQCSDDLNEIIPVLEHNFTLLEQLVDQFHKMIEDISNDKQTIIYKFDEKERESVLNEGVSLADNAEKQDVQVTFPDIEQKVE